MDASTARESWLDVLLAHLLEWRYQPEWCGASWIKEQCQRLARLLWKNPSLKANLDEIRGHVRLIVRQETGLPEAVFPLLSPFDW